MREKEVRGLMEAYSQVYETPEVLNEEVIEQLTERRGAPTDPKARAAYDANVAKNRAALGNTLLYGNAAGKKPESPVTRNRNVRGGGTIKPAASTPAAPAAAKPASTPAAPAAAKPASTPAAAKPAAAAPKPAAAAPKPTTPAPKPTTPAPGTKAAGPESIKPKTPNPLLADGGIRRMQQASQMRQKNINVTSDQLKSAERTKPTEVKKESLDVFDIVKGYLLDEGYAESEDAAMVIMVNMSEGWKESILESCGVELIDESQYARENPEKYERDERKRQSSKERRMNDPKTGINSPAFQAFMAKQMGGKKKKED